MIEPKGWRERIREIAWSWVGTPFRDHACVKGHGVDCAHLLYGVFRESGIAPDITIPHYSPQWHLHQSEEIFLGIIQQYAVEAESSDTGSVAIFKVGLAFSHGGIIVDWPNIIHASQPAKIVELHNVSRSALSSREVKFFSPRFS